MRTGHAVRVLCVFRTFATAVALLTISPAWARAESDGVMVDVTAGFVPYANDVPVMVGAGVRFDDRHEFLARVGHFVVGDDGGYGLGVVGYRNVFRARQVVPFVGGLVAAVPATCGHDALGHPRCVPVPLFIFSATAGVRFEPLPWLGLSAALLLGFDSYPNPFGMVELGVSVLLPFKRAGPSR